MAYSWRRMKNLPGGVGMNCWKRGGAASNTPSWSSKEIIHRSALLFAEQFTIFWGQLLLFRTNCTNFALSLTPPSPEDVSCGRQDILKGVYYAWFWRLEILEKFQIVCQKQSNGECPLVVIYTALIVSRPLVYPYTNGNFGHNRVVSIHTAWGFDVARFDKQGNSRSL